MVGNRLRLKISDYPSVNDYMVFHNSYLDNDFWILLIPNREWHFDYHEALKMDSAWNLASRKPVILSDAEGPYGRKTYASNTVGGYYAARLAVLEKLLQLKRKAAVLAFREVGKGYISPSQSNIIVVKAYFLHKRLWIIISKKQLNECSYSII